MQSLRNINLEPFSEFDYIKDKIIHAEIVHEPFPHLEIADFLSEEHIAQVLTNTQIHFDEQHDLETLYSTLMDSKYQIQAFPGCVSSWEDYKHCLENKKISGDEPTETLGLTFRLREYKELFLQRLMAFLNSDEFHQVLRRKFDLTKETNIISAIQKNLTGYEISPHPDIRQKALTYLLNINKNSEIEKEDCHTHLLRFTEQYQWVEEYWVKNPHVNRCWVPWSWCETVSNFNKNNSMLIFAPATSPPTLHAIRLNYDHLKYQRTQIYGNLMFTNTGGYSPGHYTLLKNPNQQLS